MRSELKPPAHKKVFYVIYRYLMFFGVLAFSLTCNITLFLGIFRLYSQVEYTDENIKMAALFTFWNAVFIAFLCTVIDMIRRKITIEMPVKRILDATDKIMQGDFFVRIKETKITLGMNEFNPIIRNINKMTEELSTIETLRTDFVSNVSHELKTPLASLQNYGMLLQQPDLSEEKREEYSKSIVVITRYLSEMISNILKLNKLENQSIYPAKQKFDVGEHICECLLKFEDGWEKKNIEIESNIESDVYIDTDAEILSIVWNNLFSNAIKFTPEGGKVSVSLKEENGIITVSVADTGCGMSEETGKHIFEKFYQGETSHSERGNGLGLALVKKVIDILNGEIYVESELGKGSRFTVKFRK